MTPLTIDALVEANLAFKTAKSTALIDAKRIAAERIENARRERDILASLLVDEAGYNISQVRDALGTTNRGTAKAAVEAGRAARREQA